MTPKRSLATQDSALYLLSDDRLDHDWSAWFAELAPWTLALTLTVKRCVNGRPISTVILEQAARHALRLLDFRCFGRRRVERGAYVPSVAVAGWGVYGDNPHLHFALAAPAGMTHLVFARNVHAAARKLVWANCQMRIEPYRDAGWLTYMARHDPENLILSCLRPACERAGAMRLIGS